MRHLPADFRYAFRTLRLQPGLAVAAILTLALGLGVNAGVWSLVDSLLLTSPPFRDPARLVIAWGSNPEAARSMGVPNQLAVSAGDFSDLARESRSVSHWSYFQRTSLNLTGIAEPEQLVAYQVTGEFFPLFGTPALLGRPLSPADDSPGRPGPVVLSHAFWQRRFGGDPAVVGRTLSLSGQPRTVVGVMPAAFQFPGGSDLVPGDVTGPDLWVPRALTAAERQNHASKNGWVFGRLRSGRSLKTAQAEVETIFGRLRQAYPEDVGWGARLAPLHPAMVARLRPTLSLLGAAVGILLLMACANVANLLLAHAASRQREIAVRTAIGASRGRLLSQLLTESLVLTFLGGGLGLALGKAGLAGFAALTPVGTLEIPPLVWDLRGLAGIALLGLLTTLLAGLVPALQASRPNLGSALRGGNGATGGSQGKRARGALVAVEVALAVLLLIGAGLLLRSFARLLAADPGFRTAGAISVEVHLPRERYPEARRRLFASQVLDRLRALPGITAAGAASDLPLTGGSNFYTFLIEGRPIPKPEQMPVAGDLRATPGYFEALGVPLLSGRTFTAADGPGAPLVAVVDRVMATTYWPGQDPLGQRFRMGLPTEKDDPWYTVIGVVGRVRGNLPTVERPQMYRSALQHPPLWLSLVVRGPHPRALFAAVGAAVREADPEEPIARESTLEEVVDATVAGRRFSLSLLGLFASLALLLAGIGIYGVTAYSVTRRTREMGLRLALGAQRGEVLLLVIREAGLLVGLGLLAGVAAALALTRVMSSFLYGIAATDPPTFVAVALLLAAIALLAAYLPGRRATRVDPKVALGAE